MRNRNLTLLVDKMKKNATSLYLRWLVVLLAWLTLGASHTLAQDALTVSKNDDYSTQDRDFDENDTIYLKVETSDVDFSSIRISEFRFLSRTEDIGYEGEFQNNFDGTFTAEIPVFEIDLTDHLWTLDGFIIDDTDNVFETRILLRIGTPEDFGAFGVRSVVEAKNSDFFVLKGYEFQVTDETAFFYAPYHHYDDEEDGEGPPVSDDGEPIPASYDDVEVGFALFVKVQQVENGDLIAREVEIIGPVHVPSHVTLTGKVERVDSNSDSFELLGQTIVINEETFIANSQEPAGDEGVPEWIVDRLIRVYGEFLDDGTVEAHFVELKEGVRPELEVRGSVEETSDNVIVVQGFRFFVGPNTTVEYPDEDLKDDGEPSGKAELSDIDPGLIVRVFSVVNPAGVNIAERIIIESGTDNGVRISGEAVGVSADGFSIRGWEIAFSEYTNLFDENFEQIPLEELSEGQRVLVFGEFREEGGIKAHHVEYRRIERDEFVLFGPITELDGNTLRVWDVDFNITEDSRVDLGPDNEGGFDALSVGQLVEVIGVPTSIGRIDIDFVHAPQGNDQAVRVRGFAENVTPENLTVFGQSVLIKPETQFRDEFYQPIDPSEVVEGVAVEVFGNFYEDGQIAAYEIKISKAGREEVEAWGLIQELDGEFMTVAGVEYILGPDSKVFVESEFGGEEGTPEELESGLFVSVLGVLDDVGNLVVDRVYVPVQPGNHVRVSGEVANASATGLTLWGQQVVFDDQTQFFNAEYFPVGPDEILDGMVVDVFGEYNDNDEIRANVVEIKGVDKEEIQVSGRLEAYDGQSVVIGGITFTIADFTQVYDDGDDNFGEDDPGLPGNASKYAGTPIGRGAPGKFAGRSVDLDELEPGTRVDVYGIPSADGQYDATVIHIRRDNANIRLGGSIEILEPDAIVVDGRRVLVSPETFIQNEEFEVVDFTSLVEGQDVEVYGDVIPGGDVVAHEIELRGEVNSFIEFWARIESIQPGLVVVGGTPFITNEVTTVSAEGAEFELTVDDLVNGQEVFISGEQDDTGALIATHIYVPGTFVWAWMRGEVTEISGDILVIQGRSVVTGLETQFLDAEYQPISLQDVEVGQVINTYGELKEDGDLMAESVEVLGSDANEIEVNGPIAVDGDLIELNGRTYILTENTFIFGEEGEVPFEELVSGLFVNLVAKPDDSGTLFVAKIYVGSQDDGAHLRFRGAIQEVLADGVVMQGRTVVFTDETMIVGPGYEPIPVEALNEGQIISVWGSFDEAGNIAAYKVETEPGKQEEIEFRGSIAQLDGDLVEIRGLAFLISENTQIQDQNGFPVEFDALDVGLLTNVIGAPDADGNLVAIFMHIGAGDQDRHINVSGPIETIDYDTRTLVVQGQSVWVEDWVEVVGANFEFISFEELAEGVNIRVFGGYELENSIHAYRVEVRGKAGGLELEFSGRIAETNPGFIVVRGITFKRGPQTYINDGEGNPIPFEELTTGQVIRIAGVPVDSGLDTPDGDHTALWISVQTGNEDRSIRVSGRLLEVDPENRVLVIRNHVIELNEYAEIVGDSYEPIRFEGLQANRQVSVWGWLHEDGRIEGWRAELRIPEKLEINVVGPVTGVFDGGIEVRNIPFAITEETFLGAAEIGRISRDDLFPGIIVEVSAVDTPDEGLEAEGIKLLGIDQSRALEVIGAVSNMNNTTFEIGGLPFVIADETFVLDGNNQRINSSAIEDGFNVEVFSINEVSGQFAAAFVRVFDIVLDERSLIGRIDELSGQRFVLNGISIQVNDETVFLDPVGDEMEYDDLTVRMRVEVKAVALANGTLIARQVEAKPRDRKLTGTVTEIDQDGMVIAGLEVTFDLSTLFYDSEDMSIDASDIRAGQTANVTMTLGTGGVPLATEVKLLARIEDEVILSGTVEAVLDDLIIVLGRRFQIIPNTQLLDASGNMTAVSSYSVGDVVRIRALLLAGDNLVALRVRALDGEAADIRVEGPIVTVNQSTLEVMGIFFFLDDDSQFFDLDRNEVAATDLAEGQTVAVIAEGQANGTVVAQRVQVQNVSLTSGEVTGIEGDQFELFGNSYRVDNNTMVLGDNNEQLDLNDIQGGQYLEVRGVAESEGSVAGKTGGPSILVSKIKIVDAEGSGEIELDVDTGDGDPEPTSTEDEALPETFELYQNYPNPFNPITTIRFALPANADVTIKVFDVTGREVQTLVAGTLNAGTHQVQWDGLSNSGRPVASGVYLYRLEAGKQIITRRMVLLK